MTKKWLIVIVGIVLILLVFGSAGYFYGDDTPGCGDGAHWVEQLQTCVGDSNEAS